MNKTPIFNRPHVVLVGKVNAGKSTLFNMLLNQSAAIVSQTPGTTTDPVLKAMELLPFGPIALLDTAGLYDETPLGAEREAKTRAALDRADVIIYVDDASSPDKRAYERARELAAKLETEMIHVLSKADKISAEELSEIKSEYPQALPFSAQDAESLETVKKVLAELLGRLADEEEERSISRWVKKGETLIMVAPIDSEAPKGRLIMPQVQLLRDCLDHGIIAVVTRPEELEAALEKVPDVSLVVTDSQAFAEVSRIVPDGIDLTSFSIIQSWQKGDFMSLLKGALAVESLEDDAKILIAESCTHNTSHEDIGRAKIPALLAKKLGKKFDFTFVSGHDFPRDVRSYSLVVHCGGCMMNRKSMLSRIAICENYLVPITNYGMLIAHLNGILERSSKIFTQKSGEV